MLDIKISKNNQNNDDNNDNESCDKTRTSTSHINTNPVKFPEKENK